MYLHLYPGKYRVAVLLGDEYASASEKKSEESKHYKVNVTNQVRADMASPYSTKSLARNIWGGLNKPLTQNH